MQLLKKRKFQIIACVGLAAGIATACSGFEETQYIFNEKTYSEYELEEHLADLLEVENSGLDIEINIYQETDD